MKWLLSGLAVLATTLLCGMSAPNPVAPPSSTPTASAVVAAPLTKADVDTWLDGFFPNALATGDVAGALVVVVKDGQVLTERGYGYADIESHTEVDPRATVFRMGSVSKLFTWTAVMQLVEAGKLDLDRDINAYLDFRIPPRAGKPITLRNLMTHTSGFEEHMKRLFVAEPERLQSLDAYVKAWTPERVFAPGEVPAYSNYAAALAGYIVQRTSGEPFAAYVDRHIFIPLGMASSTFRQPVPAAMRPHLATGYRRASGSAQPFEWLNASPAGGMSTTGDNMARFMIAELNGGQYGAGRILRAETVRQMQRPQGTPARPFPTMGLGFIPTWRNGHEVTGHDGDLQFFKTVVYLLPSDGVGVFVAMNSAGAAHAAGKIRISILHRFMDRYFPAPPPAPPQPIATARAHAAEIAGVYRSSRSAFSDFFAIRTLLSQDTVTADPDGTVAVPGLETLAGAPEQWTETAPYRWTNASGRSHFVALRRNGRVTGLATEDDTTSTMLRVPWWASASWNLPLLHATVIVLALGLLLWPLELLARRLRSSQRRALGLRAWLDAATRLTAASDLATAWIYNGLIGRMAKVQTLDDPLNAWIHLGQAFAALGCIGAVLAMLNMVATLRDDSSGWWSRLLSIVLMSACAAFVWFAFSLHLLGVSTQF